MYNAINQSDKQKSIGGRVLYPGESRPISKDEIAEALGKGLIVPGYEAKPKAVPEPPPEPPTIEELLKHSVEELAAALPEMSDEQLLALEEAEQKSETPRETLLKAIEKEIARPERVLEVGLADEPTIEEVLKHSVKELTAALPEMSDEQLLALQEAEQKSETPRETLLKAIEKEIARIGRAPK